jgi:DNA-binding NarL/FixJ family response regulator
MISIAIVEDDSEIRGVLQDYLDGQENFSCSLTADSVESFLHKLKYSDHPDLILMDIGLPGMSGINGVKLIKEKYPQIEVIMITVYDDSHKIFESLCAGASGYLLKNMPLADVKNCLEQTYHGGSSMSPSIARKVINHFRSPKPKKSPDQLLSDREKEIVLGLVEGLSYKMLASRLNISIETVRGHIKHIYKKLHVHCKAEVISKSLRGEI